MKKLFKPVVAMLSVLVALTSCNNSQNSDSKTSGALSSNVAEKVYVAPGEHDSHYAFISGGFSGNLTVYGLPSGRMFKEIPVFSLRIFNTSSTPSNFSKSRFFRCVILCKIKPRYLFHLF